MAIDRHSIIIKDTEVDGLPAVQQRPTRLEGIKQQQPNELVNVSSYF